jgi:hypothetical protein
MRILSALIVLAMLAGYACGGDGAPTYRIAVSFNETVTQANMDSVAEYLRGFDDDLDFLVQESFPPTGVAMLRTDAEDFCATVVAELESRTYISSVNCREATDVPVGNPDAPVSDEPVATAA